MRNSTRHLSVLAAGLFIVIIVATSSAQNVLTRQNDIGRTGRQLNENILTTGNVNTATFGKVFTYAVTGQIYAQPLAVSQEFITACNQIPPPTHCNIIFPADVIYVATEDDWLYAFDATGAASSAFWSVNLAATAVSGGTFVNCQMQIYSGCNSGSALYPDIGVTGTPVIDTSSNTIYVASAVSDSNQAVSTWLHAIDLGNGSEKFGGPIKIVASYPGPQNPPAGQCQTGTGTGGTVNFTASRQLQRPGLLLLNVNGTNIVYIGFSMYDGATHSNGWVLGYAVNGSQQLAQVTGAVFNTAPFGTGGGIWEAGEGLAAETRNGNTYIYVPTADGTFDVTNTTGATVDYGDSLLKLTVNSTNSIGALSIASGSTAYFTPSDQSTRCGHDTDFGSGGVMLLPSDVTVGTHLNLMINAEKLGYLWVTDRDNLSGYNPTGDLMVQKANTKLTRTGNGQQGYWSSPAYYEWGTSPNITKEVFFTITFLDRSVAPGPLNQYNLTPTGPIPVDTNGNGSPNYSTSTLFCTPVPTPSISATSSNTNGILWAVENSNSANSGGSSPACNGSSTGAVLHAYDATKVNNLELYNSGTKLSANTPTKFLPPTVFKGRVYIGTYQTLSPTNGELDVFGICTSGPTGQCL